VEENSEEKEFAKGLLGMSLEVEWETRGDSRRRLTSSSQQVLLLVQEWEIFCGRGSTPRYSFRGEGSDKDFSLQSQTRRGKLSRNTPKIQETGNL
jgi:hypothetical protein